MLYKVTVAPIPLSKKPEDFEVGQIKNSLTPTGLTIDELFTITAPPKSYTIAPAYHSGRPVNNASWTSQQSFFLDFDGTISIEETLQRFRSFGIEPNFYYFTFSHTSENPRFRIVLLTDFELSDYKTAEKIRLGLKKLFPESDPLCFDAARIFYGGKESILLNREPIPFDMLKLMVSLVWIDEDSGKTRNVPKRVSLYNYYSDTQFQTNEQDSYLSYLQSVKNNKVDYKKLAQRVKIFQDFIEGKWLHHNELFGIATSLHWLKGGRKLFNSTLKKYNDLGSTHYDKYKFKIMTYVAYMQYYPMALSKFSPYESDWEHLNLVSGVKLPIGRIERIKQAEYLSLKNATEIFEREFNEALDSNDTKIYIFKLPTGFGKSTYLTNLEGKIIAFPTHDLKEEIHQKMNVKSIITPRIPKFYDNNINIKIDNYYLMGLNEAVIKIIKSLALNSDKKTCQEDSVVANMYLTELNYSQVNKSTLLTTHQRIILDDYDSDTVIFDEDPIKDILSVDSTSLDDLILLNAHLPKDNQILKLIEILKKAEPNQVHSMPSITINMEIIRETIALHHTKTNVVRFLSCSAFIVYGNGHKKISYIVKRDLKPDKKYIILSATAQVHLYERLYPKRLKVVDLSNIPLQGKVHQYTDYSYSRASLTEDLIDDLRKRLGNIPVITFNKHKMKFSQVDLKMHFGNVLGYDGLNGKDIAIIGTPHLNEVVYRLFAFAVGIDPNTESEMKVRHIEFGDYRFCIRTYRSKQMQQIQLSLIESELIQAVGRARPLRNDCIVELYSNFPLSFSELK